MGWLLFAQMATDPLSGGSGWAGAGLLSLVLGWLLFKHLPDKDVQMSTMIKEKDELIKDLIAKKDAAVGLAFSKFSEEMEKERAAATANYTKIAESINQMCKWAKDAKECPR